MEQKCAPDYAVLPRALAGGKSHAKDTVILLLKNLQRPWTIWAMGIGGLTCSPLCNCQSARQVLADLSPNPHYSHCFLEESQFSFVSVWYTHNFSGASSPCISRAACIFMWVFIYFSTCILNCSILNYALILDLYIVLFVQVLFVCVCVLLACVRGFLSFFNQIWFDN